MESLMQNREDGWLSAYLFYDGTPESFLSFAVKPFIDLLKSMKLLQQFFFIRYREGGHHIRVRIAVPGSLVHQEVQSLLMEYFTGYFNKYPSTVLQHASAIKNDPLKERIRFVPYEPELARYGGDAFIKNAEQVFHISSAAVLNVIAAHHKDWNNYVALFMALNMHLAFLYSSGMDLNEGQHYLDRLSENDLSPPVIQNFEHQYQQHKEKISSLIFSKWNLLGHRSEPGSEWIDQLTRELSPVLDSFSALANETKWKVFDNLIHMTNNRLGLTYLDEAFIAYTLQRVLRTVDI